MLPGLFINVPIIFIDDFYAVCSDYLTLELASNNNSEDKFFAGQFGIEH